MNLKQLSGLLNLSQTTVSRALNGYPEVSEDTRRRVIEAAKRHGYRPNPSARRLATGKAGMIGYVMPTGDSVDIDAHFVEFLSGIGDYARGHELDLALSPTSPGDEETTYRRIVANQQVDAVYISSPNIADRRIQLVEMLGIPYIVHGRSEGLDFRFPFLDIDNEGAFHAATRLLLQLGHERIALVNGDAGKTFAAHRERGVRRALESQGLALQDRLLSSATMTEENGYRTAKRLMQEAERPTAIICSSLMQALGVLRAASDEGLSIPEDISVISHDDVFPFLKPEGFATPLTTTCSPIRAAGERIAERLVARIAESETGPVEEVWPVDLIVRGSVGRAPENRRRRASRN
ncbi:MAG: substrate-binding domain-containing protein [Rhizobiaceae bacterium]|nr:substrate-binding domain-containing protein [Rhizobiaceae bacterium]